MDTMTVDALGQHAVQLLTSKVEIPGGYAFLSAREVIQDGRELILLRFEREDGINAGLGGEHFSAVVSLKESRLDGAIHIDRAHTTDDIASKDEARSHALAFLRKAAPELADRAEIRWIEPLRRQPIDPPHDSPFRFFDRTTNAELAVIGTRVKLFDPQTNGYGWVVCARDGKLIAFERDIGWDRIRKCRTSEQWLHDEWVLRWAKGRGA